MAAFDRIKSGISEMDTALDNIRLGDNVVWRVSDLSEFKLFMEPYIKQAIEDKRNIIYFRFASHEPLLEESPYIKKIDVPLSHRFETFTVDIHNEIEKAGRDAFYVFDCLSELQTAWATDLMMGNFFRVTCPFLFILDTVAFFPIIRGKHSVQAINKILDTTQLFLDVYSDKKNVYVRPEKVWNRNSDTMFLPHTYNPASGEFRPILDGVKSSRFYQALGLAQRSAEEQYSDSWDKFFIRVKMLRENGIDITKECSRMCNIMMTRDTKMREMVKKNFTPEDYFAVRDHMVGTGMIGGKSCGMLLARAIIRNKEPDISEVLEPHDSFYVGSDMYYTYIVDNNLWNLRIKQRTEEGYFSLAKEFADKLMEGSFSEAMREQFVRIIEYYGQDPYIIRSSSILEDGFGNAFAGKYESVFCANRGSLEERLNEFEHAIKVVYASSMSLSALDYRKRRGLDGRDEQMALLIQRVSGSYYGSYYMPCAAGVGYSYSPYRIMKDTDPTAGMLRLVMGLGTSAVDRTEGSYPRIVNLDMPEKSSYSSSADKHKFSQGKAEVINMTTRELEKMSYEMIEQDIPKYLEKILLEHDTEAESRLREMGRRREVKFISCKGLVANAPLMDQMRRMLHCIQEEYEYPVDTEFTINISENGEYSIDLLQCRPLQVQKGKTGNVVPEDIPEERILLESVGASMGISKTSSFDLIVYVDPVKYYELPFKDKDLVAKLIGKINWHFRDMDKHMMLIVPGRVGTTSPELGVPTSFADISAYDIICETEESRAGYNPELSYGSHIFQDLVEAEILYTAIFQGEKTKHYSPEKLESSKDLIGELEFSDVLEGVVHVYDVSDRKCEIYNDVAEEHLLITC
ncbi:Pyruvate phosphate dikinase, PEP/pyruvate binding domain [Eubacterium ruminantium]|uniref:Pyruvate phosphate dikinase, PEP/pyruvate binding domain n=1 Tax=Eubacterium ruminantium TaxID=42322 RepID=A0A1T4QE96_9FIRM|nr:PEP/pyruvate-binding domain-containing protein [Eubacterium ruminantium]SCW69040.1 Pyruvate phosphate dikinase, PEP/pyruvate binding domain [Eubacterium ruminantium]SDN37446.1 Pyruvate phosphate dikinase, PEP/pyruvate binding domain [Eubacterium ruminantium]SKA01956.1 Pyruvate phosphate dikinase, PEP/pyruvate binding domain [Eubacterium ruminantium]